jgi:HlyD family secretion protein
MKNIIKWVVVVIILMLFAYAFLPEPMAVDLVTIQRGQLIISIDAEGKTRIHDIYTVSTPIDGKVTRIESEVGSRVKAGQTILANMRPSNPQFLDKRSEIQAQADVDGAKAALSLSVARKNQAQVALKFGESELRRTQEMYNKRLIPVAQLEQVELQVNNLKAELETAQSTVQVQLANLHAAETRLLQPDTSILTGTAADSNCQICIKAPVDGLVLEVLHKSESTVPVGTPLLTIGNPTDMEIELEMLSTNAIKVQPGDLAEIKRWGKDDIIQAQVRLVEPVGFTKVSALGVEEQRVRVILSFTDAYEKWQSLGHGFRVEATIITDEFADVIKVPIASMFRQDGHWAVFKVVSDRAQLQPIEVTHQNNQFASVSNGLSVGEQVIIYPSTDLHEGDLVTPR